jgi:hypothetical protein
LQVATPVVFEIVTALQRTVPPVVSVKVTLPVGRTVPVDGFTVAVKITVWFTVGVVDEDVTVTVGEALVTVSVAVAADATVKLGSPL